MDYLYDKVGFYDTLKPVMQGKTGTDGLVDAHASVLDIEQHMLHFLENHDEQRIASAGFAGSAEKGRPGMVVSALISRSPTMLYFAQDVGEPGDGDAGFGDPTRTTIFDYWGVPSHQRFMNDGAFDGGRSTPEEKALRDFYERVMRFSATNPALQGEYLELHSHNRALDGGYSDRQFAFARWNGSERLIVVSNFDTTSAKDFTLELSEELLRRWDLEEGRYRLEEQLYGDDSSRLLVDNGRAAVRLILAPLQSVVLRLGPRDIERHDDFGSAYLEPRHIDVFLPAGYHEDDEPYSVLYAHDGQNLFIPDISYTGIDWGVDEALETLVADGSVRKTIVVGIWNTPKRSREYHPAYVRELSDSSARQLIDGFIGGAPLSDDYLRFIATELKPFIDRNYRTKPGRDDTFLMGSSMGGLISKYAMQRYPDLFAGAACLSTHWPAVFGDGANSAHNETMLGHLRESIANLKDRRWYFDYGTTELDAEYEVFQLQVDNVLRELGYAENDRWITRKFEGAGHAERYWRERVQIPLEFLLRED